MKMSKFIINPFHLVEYSPWPIIGSLGALLLTSGTASWFNNFSPTLMFLGLLLIILTMIQWWRDVTREATFQGFHTHPTARGLRIGMIFFIVSEICFFFAFFWAFFHSSLAPSIELGNNWPPTGINPLSPWGVPLLNTVVLLSSGVSVTWAHHSLLVKKHHHALNGLIITVILGIYFTILQASEYMETSFSLSDSAYGTTFFVATGFHGIHVLIGTTFLLICTIRHWMNHFNQDHHLGFEAAAWYWHFVDVVWLFLFISIYWWGS
uniref:Cytochrome c oxidase subunit 3 n=1 Tax=Fenestrulina sp. BLEED20 TaxID=2138251 RepID=A0A2R4K2W8_9BILA|nr:cytochrome c oxidase subunit III [Fenestrulina sp. BLEED20]